MEEITQEFKDLMAKQDPDEHEPEEVAEVEEVLYGNC